LEHLPSVAGETGGEPDPEILTWYEEHGLSSRVTSRLAQLNIARADPRVFSLEGDQGLPAVPFEEEIPDRYLQMGIAEANLLGVAAGMAMTGKIPFVNTFASFATMRACEQLRVDIAYGHVNVKVVGSYAGLSGGPAGATHHSIEDIAIVRSMPGMVILSPADSFEAYKATCAAAEHEGPVYIRVGRADTPRVYDADYRFEIGRAVRMVDGSDVTIIATGNRVVHEALTAADRLRRSGIECGVLNVHTIKPLDRDAIVEAALKTGVVVTAEEASVLGGLGGAVAELLLEEAPSVVERVGIRDAFCDQLGPYEDMVRHYGIDAEGIAAAARLALATAERRKVGRTRSGTDRRRNSVLSIKKEVVRRHYEDGVNENDMAIATGCFATGYVNHVPGQEEPQRGIEAWTRMFGSLRAAFPDLRTTLEHLIEEGDTVVVRHTWRGTHAGHYQGIPATGRRVRFTGNDIYRVVDGKIVEEWSEYDELGLLRQLGGVPRAGALAGLDGGLR